MDGRWLLAAAPILAFGLDAAFGEPPNRWHPVRWLGEGFRRLERHAPLRAPAALAYGLAAVVAGGALVAALFALAEQALSPAALAWRPPARGWSERIPPEPAAPQSDLAEPVPPQPAPTGWPWPGGYRPEGRLPTWLAVAAYVVLLKPAFAVRALVDAGLAVERALRAGDLKAARRLVGWHLVSRPVEGLDRPRVAAAAIESLAENACDGIVAPLFWWAVAGLPGAWCYRLVNTVDAMWGYRGRYEFLGKAPARLDDLASWVPARVTALLLLGAGLGRPGDVRRGLRVWLRDAARTESPNAGHPMAAAAGLLGVRLEKVGAYVLYPEGRLPGPDDIRRARRLVRRAAWLAAALFAVLGAALLGLPPLRPAALLLAGACSLAGVAWHTRRWGSSRRAGGPEHAGS